MVAMPRSSRDAPGGMVFHVLNRGVGRRAVFEKDGNYLAFEKVMDETLRTRPMRVCACCLLPNTGTSCSGRSATVTLAALMQQLTDARVKRWKEHRHEVGSRRAWGSGPAMALSDWFPARFEGRHGIVGPASENPGLLTRPLACHFDASVDVTDAGKQDAIGRVSSMSGFAPRRRDERTRRVPSSSLQSASRCGPPPVSSRMSSARWRPERAFGPS